MAAVIAFTSEKGGVGKTNIATNLGLSLSVRNAKVCLFDADTGLANINILMGIYTPYTIEHVLNGQKNIDEIIIDHPSGISVVPAASRIKQCANLDDKQLAILVSSLERLEKNFDYLLIDTAAGIDSNVLDFVASGQYRVVVITPEPTSLTDSFALLKMLIIRGKKKSIFILVNRVEDYQLSQVVFKRFQKAVKTYLKIEVHYLGYLTDDDKVNKAVAQQKPVVISYPDSAVSCGFASMADIVKRQFRNDKNLPYFSGFWTLNAQQGIKEKVTVAKIENTNPLPINDYTNKTNKTNTTNTTNNKNDTNLSVFYDLLNQQTLSEEKLKELILTLESIYEKKYKQSIKEPGSIIALLLAEGDAGRIQKLHSAIGQSYEQQFGKKISNPVNDFKNLIKDEKFSKNNFDFLFKNMTDIYQQRLKEKYVSEGNKLLTQIQQLLSKNSNKE